MITLTACAVGYTIAGCNAPRRLESPGTREPETLSVLDPAQHLKSTPVVTGILAMPEWKKALHRLSMKPAPKCRACYDTKSIITVADVATGYWESEPCPECAIAGEAA